MKFSSKELKECPICHTKPEIKYACGEYFVECSGGCKSPACFHPSESATILSWNDWAEWFTKMRPKESSSDSRGGKMTDIDILHAELLNNQNPLYCARKALCDSVDRAVEALEEKAKREKNSPLTFEELQEMDGQPCYLTDMEPPEYGWENGWYLIDAETETVYNQDKAFFIKSAVGLAYRFKKEEIN